MRIKILVGIILGLIFSKCNFNREVSLKKDPIVNLVFNKKEVLSLTSMVNFLDSIILSSVDIENIDEAYKNFFTPNSDDSNLTYEELYVLLKKKNKNNTEKLIRKLKIDNVLFEIWSFKQSQKYRYFDLNKKGKYMQVLELLGKEDNNISEYLNNIRGSGNASSPFIISKFLHNYHKQFKFQRELYRLIFAIHYITVFSEEEIETNLDLPHPPKTL